MCNLTTTECSIEAKKSTSKSKPHTRHAFDHLMLAKSSVCRAIWQFPEEIALPGNLRPPRLKLQRIAGTLSILAEILEPLIAAEPLESETRESGVAQ